MIDYGTEDKYPWIPPGSEYLSKQLSEAGIQNQIYRFEGGHGDHLRERLIEVMLPFFDRVLADPYDPVNLAIIFNIAMNPPLLPEPPVELPQLAATFNLDRVILITQTRYYRQLISIKRRSIL